MIHGNCCSLISLWPKQSIGCNIFPCRKDKTKQVSDPDDLQLLWQKVQKQEEEHCLHLLMKGPDPGFHVLW